MKGHSLLDEWPSFFSMFLLLQKIFISPNPYFPTSEQI